MVKLLVELIIPFALGFLVGNYFKFRVVNMFPSLFRPTSIPPRYITWQIVENENDRHVA